MELCGIEIILAQRRAERDDEVGCADRVRAARHVVTVDEKDVAALADMGKEGGAEAVQRVPAHVRHFLVVTSGNETRYSGGDDAEAVRVALRAVGAEKLLADADAQDGLAERGDDAVQPPGTQICHRARCLALARKDHAVGRGQGGRVVRNGGFDAQSPERIDDGADVACVVFYDSYFHVLIGGVSRETAIMATKIRI